MLSSPYFQYFKAQVTLPCGSSPKHRPQMSTHQPPTLRHLPPTETSPSHVTTLCHVPNHVQAAATKAAHRSYHRGMIGHPRLVATLVEYSGLRTRQSRLDLLRGDLGGVSPPNWMNSEPQVVTAFLFFSSPACIWTNQEARASNCFDGASTTASGNCLRREVAQIGYSGVPTCL